MNGKILLDEYYERRQQWQTEVEKRVMIMF
jgi:hypothetical protein